MPDNVSANGGPFRSLEDSDGNQWPAEVLGFVTGGSAGAWLLQYISQQFGLPTVSQQMTPRAATSNITVTSGVILVSGPVNGGFIANPSSASAQGLGATENVYIDPVAMPGNSETNANGTTTSIAPGQTYVVPALASGANIYGNAPSPTHKVTAVVW